MRRRALLFSALLLAFAGSSPASEGPRKPGAPTLTGVPKVATRGDFTAFDVNTISTFIRNNGSFNRDPLTGYAGFIWPKGTGKIANYASGIWLGAKVGDSVRVALAEYTCEYDAGPIASGVNPDDERWRVYKIKTGDNAGNSTDYASWPWADGAPVVQKLDGSGDSLDTHGDRIPELIGDMTAWCVFNDNNAAFHTMMHTAPLGIEIQLTAYGFDRADALGNTIFYKWNLINKGGNTLDSAYVGIWTDIDLGDPRDDYDGCDTVRGLGYTYNADSFDLLYGSTPPATGFDLLQGPLVPGNATDTARFPGGRIVPGKQILHMTSYVRYYGEVGQFGTPETGPQALNYLQGRSCFGAAILDPRGRPTTFMYPGDPAQSYNDDTNWIENEPAGERTFLMAAGPFTMVAGDTQVIVAANIIAQGADARASVAALKTADDFVQEAYFPPGPVSSSSDDPHGPSAFRLYQNYPNPFNPVTKIAYTLPKAVHVQLKIYNVLGEVVASVVDGYVQPGSWSAQFDGSKLPSGIYFYRLTAGEFVEVKKMMLLK